MTALARQPDIKPDRSKKFLILALPRSRTAWLSKFLSYGDHKVGHDIATDCSSISEFLDKFDQLSGTVETGAVIAWRTLRTLLPEVQIIVIKRPVEAILASFATNGIYSSNLERELRERAIMLDHVSAQQNVITLTFDDLSDDLKCNTLFEACTGEPTDFAWWDEYKNKNIQIDLAARMQKLIANRDAIASLKKDAIEYLPELAIELEALPSFINEMEVIGFDHFDEVDGGVEPNRPYKLDTELLMGMWRIGSFKAITARVKGNLVGYCTWNIMPDVESKGLGVAHQGAWYVAEGYEHLRLGVKLFKASIVELRKFGVKNIFPHHRLQGRGARLGLLFQRMGAKEIQHTYSLWIGDT